jgi:hypothetical protein
MLTHGFCLLILQGTPMAFDMLPALRPRHWRATVYVRVCRKWEYRGGTDDGPIQHVDLVLLDEQVYNHVFDCSCVLLGLNAPVWFPVSIPSAPTTAE